MFCMISDEGEKNQSDIRELFTLSIYSVYPLRESYKELCFFLISSYSLLNRKYTSSVGT